MIRKIRNNNNHNKFRKSNIQKFSSRNLNNNRRSRKINNNKLKSKTKATQKYRPMNPMSAKRVE